MEFGFELALCAHLEATTDWVVGRQLGAGVEAPADRVVDVCGVVPGPEFDDRAAVTERTIPAAAVESDVGAGEAVFWKDAFDCRDAHARRTTDRALAAGFFVAERRGGREYVRRTTRYPDWIGGLVGIENKPDLGSPGELERQLRTDASLAVFDEVVLATESYVTRAHLNRLPDEVGVWRFDPETGEREVVRAAERLPVERPGIELLDRRPLRTDVAVVGPAAKARRRRRIAERAYGKGWRTYEFPGCANVDPTADGRPRCAAFDRTVDPGRECGPDCPARDPAPPPDVETGALRDERSPWVRDPDGVADRQAGLDRFG